MSVNPKDDRVPTSRLVQRAQAGDRKATTEIFHRLWGLLQRFFHGKVPRNVSRDTQDAAMKSLATTVDWVLKRKFDELKTGGLRALALKIASRDRLDLHKEGFAAKRAKVVVLSGSGSTDPLSDFADKKVDVEKTTIARNDAYKALKQLQKKLGKKSLSDTLAYVRNRVEDEDLRTIAADMGCGEDALRKRLSRAENAVRHELKKAARRESD